MVLLKIRFREDIGIRSYKNSTPPGLNRASLTPRSVSHFWIFGHFNFPTLCSVILRRVGLPTVLYCPELDSAQCYTAPRWIPHSVIPCAELDSAQCYTEQSWTAHSGIPCAELDSA